MDNECDYVSDWMSLRWVAPPTESVDESSDYWRERARVVFDRKIIVEIN